MVTNDGFGIEKCLNRDIPSSKGMKKEACLKGDSLIEAIKEAQQDSDFMKDVNKFIRATTS